jgi:aromatic-L-amino-acid decarboxylase
MEDVSPARRRDPTPIDTLKVWMTIAAYGADRLGQVADGCCALARRLADRVDTVPLLHRMAPAPLNIACFRFPTGDDAMQGVLRAAIVNHRTRADVVDALVDAVFAAGRPRDRVR